MNTPTPDTSPWAWRRPLALTAALLLPVGLRAQATDAADPSATDEEEETIVLSPFEVSTEKDTGYLATNTLGGTKLNTAVKDLPFAVDLITSDFIRDIGARSVEQALNFTAGVDVVAGTGGATDTTISVRGLPSNFFLRDGVAIYRSPSWAMVDRIEVIRGASAIVYGQTQPGGVVNITTKKPDLTERRGSIEQTVGQWNNFETRVDLNQPLIKDKLGIRIAASYKDSEGNREGFHAEAYTFLPSLTYKPFDGTTITLQYAKDRNKTSGILFGLPPAAGTPKTFGYLDQNYESYYNSLSPQERALQNLPTPDSLRTAANGGPAPIFMENPYTLNPAGGNGFWNSERTDKIVNIKQELVRERAGHLVESSHLQFNFAYIDDDVRSQIPLMSMPNAQGAGVNNWADVRWMPDGAAQWGGEGNQWSMGSDYNDASISDSERNQLGYYHLYNETPPGPFNMAGSGFFDPVDATNPANANVVPLAGPNTFYWYPMVYMLRNTNEIYTLDNVTKFNFADKAQLRLLVGMEYGRQEYFDPGRKGNLDPSEYNATRDAWSSTAWGPGPSNLHWNLPNWGYGFTGDGQNPASIWGAGDDRRYRGWNIWNGDTGERRAARISGDEIDAIVRENYYGLTQKIRYSAFYMTGQLDLFEKRLQLLGAVRHSRINKEDYRVQGLVDDFPLKYEPTVPQVGIVFNITKDINVYASYAQNYWYEWSRAANELGEAPPPNEGESWEFGSKYTLFDGKVTGSIALFESSYQNLTWQDRTVNLTELNPSRYPPTSRDIDGDGQPDLGADGRPILYPIFGLNRFDGEATARGLEFNALIRPVADYDITVSYSYLDTEIKKAAQWMAGLEFPGTPDHMLSFWNRYTFNQFDGWVKGLEIGAGVVYRSGVWVGSGFSQAALGDSDVYWKTPTFVRIDAMVAYPFKMFDYDWRVQVNVRNLADRLNWNSTANLQPDGQGREVYGSLRVSF